MKIAILALYVFGFGAGFIIGFSVGQSSGMDKGAAIMRMTMEQDAVNHGKAEYYIEQRKVKWRWK